MMIETITAIIAMIIMMTARTNTPMTVESTAEPLPQVFQVFPAKELQCC